LEIRLVSRPDPSLELDGSGLRLIEVITGAVLAAIGLKGRRVLAGELLREGEQPDHGLQAAFLSDLETFWLRCWDDCRGASIRQADFL
jgi:hypothetical protein